MTPLPLAPVETQGKLLRGRLRRPFPPMATRSPGLEDGKQAQPRERRATSDDAELATLRAVSCATVLESVSGWKLDAGESTRRALDYRRDGEVPIVNHDGRGWWDPLTQAKGDVFSLVQRLTPGLNFGHVRPPDLGTGLVRA